MQQEKQAQIEKVGRRGTKEDVWKRGRMKGSKEGRRNESKKKTTRDKIQSIVVCCGVQMRKLATFRRIKM